MNKHKEQDKNKIVYFNTDFYLLYCRKTLSQRSSKMDDFLFLEHTWLTDYILLTTSY